MPLSPFPRGRSMTASVGREVHRNRLSAAALQGAVAHAEAEDTGGEDFADLEEADGGGEGIKVWRHGVESRLRLLSERATLWVEGSTNPLK
jgi:hypothetical protein